ncbi:MAG: hypothetical protein JXA57_01155 [Armatimonadetes bacterium]|nr:hypothetical protein [Armatimonadota bacterium]
MHTEDQWAHVLQLLRLPAEPSILIVAPDTEDALLGLVRRHYPEARCSVLELPGLDASTSSSVHTRVELTRLHGSEHMFDVALFDHALDDIVMGGVARNEGISRTDTGLGEYAPGPRAIRAYWRSGELEAVAAPELVSTIGACAQALRPGGHLILHHRVENAHLTQGQPMDLYTEYVPLARTWLRHGKLDLTEVSLDSLDPQWWLCLTAK